MIFILRVLYICNIIIIYLYNGCHIYVSTVIATERINDKTADIIGENIKNALVPIKVGLESKKNNKLLIRWQETKIRS